MELEFAAKFRGSLCEHNSAVVLFRSFVWSPTTWFFSSNNWKASSYAHLFLAIHAGNELLILRGKHLPKPTRRRTRSLKTTFDFFAFKGVGWWTGDLLMVLNSLFSSHVVDVIVVARRTSYFLVAILKYNFFPRYYSWLMKVLRSDNRYRSIWYSFRR